MVWFSRTSTNYVGSMMRVSPTGILGPYLEGFLETLIYRAFGASRFSLRERLLYLPLGS
jgi:hypothetical protein